MLAGTSKKLEFLQIPSFFDSPIAVCFYGYRTCSYISVRNLIMYK